MQTSTEARVPWESLRYLIGETIYGGRVTDDYDRRILMTYLSEYMGDFLFDAFQPFHFFQSGNVDYTVPKAYSRDAFLTYIESLPLANSPEVN